MQRQTNRITNSDEKKYKILSTEGFVSSLLQEENPVYFVASGVSMWDPSNLPTGRELKRNLFAGITNDRHLQHCFNWVYGHDGKLVSDEQWAKVPLEAIFGFIYGEIGNRLFKGLTFFESTKFNALHHLLVLLALNTEDRTIITTNFDLLFEACCPKKVMSCYTTVPKHPSADSVRLVKLHGTYADKESIVMTLEREGTGLRPPLRKFLQEFLPGKVICFIGYSASEFDIVPMLTDIPFSRIYWIEKDRESVWGNPRMLRILNKNKSLIGLDLCTIFREICHRKFPKLSMPTPCLHEDKSRGIIDFLAVELNHYQKFFIGARIFRGILRPTLSLKLLKKGRKLWRKRQLGALTQHVLRILDYELAETYKERGDYLRAKTCYEHYYNKTTSDPRIPSIEILRAEKKIAEISLLRHEFRSATAILSRLRNKIKSELRKGARNQELFEKLLWDCDLNYAGVQLWKIVIGEVSQQGLPEIERLLGEVKESAVNEGSIDVQAEATRLLARCKSIEGKFQDAYKALDEALDGFGYVGRTIGEINTLREKANDLTLQKDYSKAIGIHKEILRMSGEFDKDYPTRLKSLLALAYLCLLSHYLFETIRYGTESLLLSLWCVLFGKVPFSMIKNVARGGLSGGVP